MQDFLVTIGTTFLFFVLKDSSFTIVFPVDSQEYHIKILGRDLNCLNAVCFLLRDAHSSKCSIAIVSRPSVSPSVTLTYRGYIGLTSSKLNTQIISLGSSLLGATTSAVVGWNRGGSLLSAENLQYL